MVPGRSTLYWRDIESAPSWLLQNLSTAPSEELTKICIVLWGIWYWRNKKVLDGKIVTPKFAMKYSFSIHKEWTEATHEPINEFGIQTSIERVARNVVHKWKKPITSTFKINVDASVYPGAHRYSVGMVLRNHEGFFVAGRTCCFAGEMRN